MELIRPGSTFDFVGKRHGFLVASAMMNLLSMVLLLTWGLSYGPDFTGGAMVEVRFREPTTSAHVRQVIQQAGLADVTIQEIDSDSTMFLLRTAHSEDELAQAGTAVTAALTASFQDHYEVLRVEAVGSRVSKDLWDKALWTVALATVFMKEGDVMATDAQRQKSACRKQRHKDKVRLLPPHTDVVRFH